MKGQSSVDGKRVREGEKSSLLVLFILLCAFSMRSPMGCVGPLMDEIMKDLGLSGKEGGMLTTLPLLLFALGAVSYPFINARAGVKGTFLLSFLSVFAGIVVRSSGRKLLLFLGTAFIGTGTGILNVAVPAFFKECHAEESGKLSGVYSSSLTFSSASTAFFIEGLALFLGSWRRAFLSVALFPLMAFLISFTVVGGRKKTEKGGGGRTAWSRRNIFAAVYMGIQSLVFYVVLTWYPTMITSAGRLKGGCGYLISVMQLASFFPAFIVPVITKRDNISRIAFLMPLIFIPGFIMAFFSHGTFLLITGTVIFGISLGATFSMGISLCTVLGKDSADTASMMSFGQSLGYILASFGPAFFGFLYDVSGKWTLSAILLVLLAPVMSLSSLLIPSSTEEERGK